MNIPKGLVDAFSKRVYLNSAVGAATGLDTTTLQNWAAKGMISPFMSLGAGPGGRRLYSLADVVRLAVIKSLIDFGFPPSEVKGVVAGLREDPEAWASIFEGKSDNQIVNPWLMVQKKADGYFVTIHQERYADGGSKLGSIVLTSRRCFCLDLGTILRDTCRALEVAGW